MAPRAKLGHAVTFFSRFQGKIGLLSHFCAGASLNHPPLEYGPENVPAELRSKACLSPQPKTFRHPGQNEAILKRAPTLLIAFKRCTALVALGRLTAITSRHLSATEGPHSNLLRSACAQKTIFFE